MKELLAEYAQYNLWANNRLVAALLQLSDGETDKEIVSSFPSIRATVSHTWSAEFIWLQRLTLVEQQVWIGSDYAGNIDEGCDKWLQVSAGLRQFIENERDETALRRMLPYQDRAKIARQMPVYQVLQHVFNHSSYHRGQMVTMLRQVNKTDIPGTDFIGFAMGK